MKRTITASGPSPVAAPDGGKAFDGACPDRHPLHALAHLIRRGSLRTSEGYAILVTLLVTSRLIRGYFEPLLRRLGLYETKLGALIVLHAFDPESVIQADLAAYTQVSQATMTDVIDVLVSEKRVTRNPDPLDRRAHRIRLTSEGRDFLNTTVRPALAALEHCTLGLTSEERHIFARVCARICAQFSFQPDGVPAAPGSP
ncbi:MarR family winged helix-turn-helix transcriptional regulator [Geminisphaera colitermitum]|uniref:MarR family winged helix-turn-helix transcriptional regulator n=1 Tax=Geminisphaera colitermitum TaxID=1148786 RepID=UPI000158CF0B|nr:MarR family winged helix-turn-helix transcriptional regulator [Geminisphaera colitermitum]